jgi:formylmethanofuran dehydrogenase subunit D
VEKIDVTLISGRTTLQGVGLEEGKTSQAYAKSVGYIELNTSDVEKLGLREGQLVKVSNENGSVVLEWKKTDGLDAGIAFIPYSPWANQLFSYETESTGMPWFKGIPAIIQEETQKKMLSLQEIVESLRSGK